MVQGDRPKTRQEILLLLLDSSPGLVIREIESLNHRTPKF